MLEALLVETGARQEFEPYTPPDITLEGRVDLRELPTFTIDPETAKDFDDALSIDDERAYVHIADVSYFIAAGSPLDRGAAQRGFSTYVPGLVAPMLPHELADDLCSLRPHVDRLCVTVELPDSAIDSASRRSTAPSSAATRGCRTGRRSGSSPAPSRSRTLDVLRRLDERARELRRRRFARGALRIQTPEVVFDFDGRGGVADARRRGRAGGACARRGVHDRARTRRSPSCSRRATAPRSTACTSVRSRSRSSCCSRSSPSSRCRRRRRPRSSRRPSAAAVAAAAAEQVATYVAQSGRGRDAFPALVLRALKQARYDPRNLGHSGLASRAYCHFTSPIRRYPDLVCHRALLRELGVGDDPLPDELGELAEHVSAREREAAQIEYQADEICLAWLLDSVLFEKGWEATFDGEIVGVIGSGLFVRFDDVFEGFLPARRLPGDYFEASPLGTALTGRRGGGTFRLGDPIDVRVERIERTVRQGRSLARLTLAPWPSRSSRRTGRRGTSTTCSSGTRPASCSPAPR